MSLPTAIAAGSSLLNGLINRGNAKRDAKKARAQYLQDREYNTPKNQLGRVKDAGLPMAAYLGGSASQQSATGEQKPAETDSGLGEAGEAIGNIHNTKISRLQTEILEQELIIKTNDARTSTAYTDRDLEDITDVEYDKDTQTDTVTTEPRFYSEKRTEQDTKNQTLLGKEWDNKIKEITADIKNKESKTTVISNMYKWMIQQQTLKKLGIENSLAQYNLTEVEEQEQYRKILRQASNKIFTDIMAGKFPDMKDAVIFALSAVERTLSK